MKIKLVGFFLSVLFSAAVFSQPINLVDCSINDIYLTKEGSYGAVNLKIFSDMMEAQNKHDARELKRMLKEKTIVKLNAGDKACLISDAPTWYRKQIRINDSDLTYWVPDEALIKVE